MEAEAMGSRPGQQGVIAMKQKILVVEHDKKIALALVVHLRAAGYEVIAAPDAVLAMSLALKHRPDLVVLDVRMPGGNGFLVAEWLQDLEGMLGVPVMFLSAHRQPGLRERARRLGAVGFFEHPYDAEALLATIRDTLDGPGDPDLPGFSGESVVYALPEVALTPFGVSEQGGL
jgi:DNA-binding response OmpR family regulator